MPKRIEATNEEQHVLEFFTMCLEQSPTVFDVENAVHYVAILGQAVGKYLSCVDDAANEDTKDQHPEDEYRNPYRQTFLANFIDAYTKHRDLHDKIREGKKAGEELLDKVCESHKMYKN